MPDSALAAIGVLTAVEGDLVTMAGDCRGSRFCCCGRNFGLFLCHGREVWPNHSIHVTSACLVALLLYSWAPVPFSFVLACIKIVSCLNIYHFLTEFCVSIANIHGKYERVRERFTWRRHITDDGLTVLSPVENQFHGMVISIHYFFPFA